MRNENYLINKLAEARHKVLKDFYSGKNISYELLDYLDLDIYAKPKTLFQRMDHGIKSSFLESNVVLTSQQISCLNILSNKNLFLSAPTSFGKTFVALEYIKRNIHSLQNIVIIVPTLSLMQEIRKKCNKYFGNEANLILSEEQLTLRDKTKKNFFVLVPERYLNSEIKKYLEENGIDFLVFDEIYKLGQSGDKVGGDKRNILMNYTFKNLLKKASKFILLGPFIRSVNLDENKYNMETYITNLNLVYNSFHRVGHDFKVIGNSEDKRFVYFSIPKNINSYIPLLALDTMNDLEIHNEAIEWLEKEYDKDFYYNCLLKKGIGIHHGNTPKFLRVYIERHYAMSTIHTILCTSTLVEGINTDTQSVYLMNAPFSKLQLNNIIGRVGRLNTDNPQEGKIYYRDNKIQTMLNEETWVDLELVSESKTVTQEDKALDEILYLEKDSESHSYKWQEFIQLIENHGVNQEQIKELGIEPGLLKDFIIEFEGGSFKNAKDRQALQILLRICNPRNNIQNSLNFDCFDFSKSSNFKGDGYTCVYNPMLNLIQYPNSFKYCINRFKDDYSKFDDYSSKDINNYIDVLYRIDNIIKYDLTKMSPIIDLIVGSVKSKSYSGLLQLNSNLKKHSQKNGMTRILEDLGFPYPDIALINKVQATKPDLENIDSLLSFVKMSKFNSLSPFGKELIIDYIGE